MILGRKQQNNEREVLKKFEKFEKDDNLKVFRVQWTRLIVTGCRASDSLDCEL